MRQTGIELGRKSGRKQLLDSIRIRFLFFTFYVNESARMQPLSLSMISRILFSFLPLFLCKWAFFLSLPEGLVFYFIWGSAAAGQDLIATHRSQHTHTPPANLHKFLQFRSSFLSVVQIFYANSSALFANHVPRATPLSITELISSDSGLFRDMAWVLVAWLLDRFGICELLGCGLLAKGVVYFANYELSSESLTRNCLGVWTEVGTTIRCYWMI